MPLVSVSSGSRDFLFSLGNTMIGQRDFDLLLLIPSSRSLIPLNLVDGLSCFSAQ